MYSQPGVNITQIKKNTQPVLQNNEMIPLFIGTSCEKVMVYQKVIRAVDVVSDVGDVSEISNDDIIPCSQAYNANDVVIGYTKGSNYFTHGDAESESKDCVITDVKTVDLVVTGWKLTWSGTKKPLPGAAYYVSYKHTIVEEDDVDNWFKPKLITQGDDIQSILGSYGRELDASGTTNNLAISVYLALLNGAPYVYALPVPFSETDAGLATNYGELLTKYVNQMKDVWRVIPVDQSEAVNEKIDAHISFSASESQKSPKATIYSFPMTATDAETAMGAIIVKARTRASSRISIVYPDKVTIVRPDGSRTEETAQFLCAAIAGLEKSISGFLPKTRRTILGISKVGSFISQYNNTRLNAIAAEGVLICHQPNGDNGNVLIRHQLTTDMSSLQTREMSVLNIIDYTTLTLSETCEQYIGKYNINSDLVSRLKGTIETICATLVQDGWLTSATVNDIYQDADSPDTILIDISITVPYPCNQINLTLVIG